MASKWTQKAAKKALQEIARDGVEVWARDKYSPSYVPGLIRKLKRVAAEGEPSRTAPVAQYVRYAGINGESLRYWMRVRGETISTIRMKSGKQWPLDTPEKLFEGVLVPLAAILRVKPADLLNPPPVEKAPEVNWEIVRRDAKIDRLQSRLAGVTQQLDAAQVALDTARKLMVAE